MWPDTSISQEAFVSGLGKYADVMAILRSQPLEEGLSLLPSGEGSFQPAAAEGEHAEERGCTEGGCEVQ